MAQAQFDETQGVPDAMTQQDPPRSGGDSDPRAAEYVLGLLEGGDRRDFEMALNESADLRADVVRWQEHFAALGMDVEEVAPPASVFEHLKRELWNENKLPWHRRLRIWEFAIGGVAAALVAYAVIVTGNFNLEPTAPAYQARIESAESNIQLVALFDEGTDLLRIERGGAPALPDRAYELWAIAGDNAPVSLGVLSAGPLTAFRLSEAQSALLREGTLLALSDEPAGGSPTGAPTGAVLGAGPVELLTNL